MSLLVSFCRRRSGLTLVELLVVLGLIGAVSAAILIGWERGSQVRSLRAGQATIASLLGATRGQAALADADVVLVVDVEDPFSESYLRSLRLFCVEPIPDGSWLSVAASLPAGVRLVPPPEMNLPGVDYADDWPTSAGSSSLLHADPSIPFGFLGVARFNPSGELSWGKGGVMLAAPVRQEGRWTFRNIGSARVVTLSRYGVVTVIGGEAAW